MDSSKPPIQSQGLSTLQYTPASYTHSQPPYQEVPHFHQRDHQSDSTIPSTAAKQPYITDDMAIAKAQKHAKWAISALNFEDAETAVRELREALKTLGAS
jgi:vacuolar protein sorting-associated protein VTA1